MKTNLDRIKNDIEYISKFNTTPGDGTTRFSYTEEDKKVREYLIKEMEKIGLQITVDPIGNIRGRMEGKNPSLPSIMAGSHIDTVEHGGNFDGVAGVITALESLRSMKENKFLPDHSVELVVFVEEEGPNFNFPLGGSRIMTGAYSVEDLKKQINADGVSMYEAAKKFDLNPDKMDKYVVKKGDIKAMIELHIEQSVVLDELNIPVGIVQAAAGRKWIEIEILGDSNHAGATPMKFRRDAMVGASKIISKVDELTTEKAFESTVATVGKINCYPNVPNVIPERVVFILEIRDTDKKGIEIVREEVEKNMEVICDKLNLKYKTKELSKTEPIIFSDEVINTIKDSAEEQNIKHKMMNSGALHDACLMAGVTDVGMIFVPSIKGRSHCPEEFTNYEDIKTGADVLLGALVKLSSI
ncbi:MAG: M20 family metallo-hydrolase [Bacillota bacterium]|nr:M20 family metallo-hydrolase [Bacillota bacterium]